MFVCEDVAHNFRPQEVKMTNYSKKNQTVLFVDQISQKIFKKITTIKNNPMLYRIMLKNKMKTFPMKCKGDSQNIDPKTVRTKNNRLVMQSEFPVYIIKKSIFVREQEAKILLSHLGIKKPLSKIPLLNVLF